MEDHRFEREVNVRFDTIRELMALCESDGDLLSSHGTLEDCLRLVEHVLFRPLPTPDHIKYNAAGVEIPFLDPNWDYIELVHDFFLQTVANAINAIPERVLSAKEKEAFMTVGEAAVGD